MRDLILIVYPHTCFYDLNDVYLNLQGGSQASAVRALALFICAVRLERLLKIVNICSHVITV